MSLSSCSTWRTVDTEINFGSFPCHMVKYVYFAVLLMFLEREVTANQTFREARQQLILKLQIIESYLVVI